MSNNYEKFWLEDPCVLVTNFKLLPGGDDGINVQLNCLTRIIIIVSGILYAMEYKYWLNFLILSLMFTFVIKIASRKKEGFTLPSKYTENSTPMTTVPPLFAEEWQAPEPYYDVYTNAMSCDNVCPSDEPTYDNDNRPIHAQYITHSNYQPYKEEYTTTQSLDDAKLYQNDQYLEDDLAFRNDMMRNYINRVDRMYKHGFYDSISPGASW